MTELTFDEIRRLFDQLAEMGALWLLLTGGEPLLRSDFEEIYLYAKRKGFLITIFSNGTLVNERTLNLLSRYPPFVIEVSLYGATKEIYESVTRVRGSYERCMDGIQMILNAGLKLKLKSMALTINQNEIEAMYMVAQKLGCEFRFDPVLNKRIDTYEFSDPVRYRVPPYDVVRLDKRFSKRMKELQQFCEKFVRQPVKDDRLYKCGAGIGLMHINPYGLAKNCMMAMDGFSIREHEIKWIWEEGIFSAIAQRKEFSLPCDNCHLTNLCGQCVAWSILENGDVKKEVAYLCEIAKIRQRDFAFVIKTLDRGQNEKKEMV